MVTGTMSLKFDTLPQSVDDIKASAYGSLSEPEYTAGLFVAAMMMYEKDKDLAFEMVNFLKGPEPLNNFKLSFINDRLEKGAKFYKIRSYFEGSTPDNDYTPEMPYTTVPIIRREDTFENEGWARVFMKSTGADTEREVRLRLKKSTGQWFLNEEYLLPDIRVPKSADPWT